MNKHVVQQFIKMLNNLDGQMVKATQHADLKKYDVNNLLNERLIVDMLPFVKQVQIACDNAKFATARLSFSEAPKFEDNEKTMAELRERVKKTTDWLKTKVEADFSKYKDAKYDPAWMKGQWLDGETYYNEFVEANFYFHANMAYAILRKAGVEIGKADYIGALNFRN